MAWTSNQPFGNFSLPLNSSSAAPWLPLNANFAKNNVQRAVEQIARAQQLIAFRKSHFAPNRIEKHGNYLFHYIFEGELVLERYFSSSMYIHRERSKVSGVVDESGQVSAGDENGEKVTSRARYVLFANFGRESKVKDLRDKFHSGSIKVSSNLKRVRDFLYIKNLRLDPGEAIIAQVE